MGALAWDHTATLCWIVWHETVQPQIGCHRFDNEAMKTVEGQQVIRTIGSNFPSPSWDTNASDHAAQMTEYLQEQLRTHFPKEKKKKGGTTITDVSRSMHGTFTALRRKIRAVQARENMLYQWFVFMAWKNQETTFPPVHQWTGRLSLRKAFKKDTDCGDNWLQTGRTSFRTWPRKHPMPQ